MKMRVRTLALCGSIGLLLGACEPEKPLFEPSARSTTQVALPAKPDLTVREYKKSHADGALTVEGVVRQRKSYLGKEVMVRGVVVELVRCPDPTPEELAAHQADFDRRKEELEKIWGKKKVAESGKPVWKPFKRARTCNPRPQAFLADATKDDRYKLLVAGSMYSQLADFNLGDTVTLTGRFDVSDPEGLYVSQRGVLSLDDKPEPVPEPTPEAPAAQIEQGK